MSINIFILKKPTKPKPPFQCWVKGAEEGHANGHRTGTPEKKLGIAQHGKRKLWLFYFGFSMYIKVTNEKDRLYCQGLLR